MDYIPRTHLLWNYIYVNLLKSIGSAQKNKIGDKITPLTEVSIWINLRKI